MSRSKLREIIFGYRTTAGKIFDIFLLAAIIISVIGVILDSDKRIHEDLVMSYSSWNGVLLYSLLLNIC